MPMPGSPVVVAGDAAPVVAARLHELGADLFVTDARGPTPANVAAAALRRLAGELPPRAPQPLYVDAPLARLPGLGLRPPPVHS